MSIEIYDSCQNEIYTKWNLSCQTEFMYTARFMLKSVYAKWDLCLMRFLPTEIYNKKMYIKRDL